MLVEHQWADSKTVSCFVYTEQHAVSDVLASNRSIPQIID